MDTITQWQRVVIADLRKVIAEPFFWFIFIAPLLLGWGLHYLLPYLNATITAFQLADYYPPIVALIILTPPMYYGFVIALLLLEEKDEGVLLAVSVTPMRLSWFLLARLSIYTLVSLPLIVIVYEIIGVLEVNRIELLLIAVASAPMAPMIAMMLSAFCKNQLEGFVMGKGMGFIVLLPLAMYFVPGYWHLLCGFLPTYWPIIAFYTAASGDEAAAFFYLAIVMALLMQSVAAVMLYKRLESQVRI